MRGRIEPVSTIFDDFRAWHAKFSPDNRLIVCSGLGIPRIWDIASSTEVPHSLLRGQIVVAPDNSSLVVIDREGVQSIHAYSMQQFQKLAEFSTGQWGGRWAIGASMDPKIWDVAFVPAGDYLILGRNDAKFSIFSWPSLREITTIPFYNEEEIDRLNIGIIDFPGALKLSWMLQIDFDPRSQLLAICAGQEITFWNLQARQLVRRISKPSVDSGANFHFCKFAFSRDGKYLAAGFDYAPVMLWDLESYSGQPKWKADGVSGGYIQALSFSYDGKVIVSAGRGGVLNILDSTNGNTLAEVQNRTSSRYGGASGGNDEIFDLDISKSGRLVTCDRGDKVKVWQLQY